jgi:hypothetical protein
MSSAEHGIALDDEIPGNPVDYIDQRRFELVNEAVITMHNCTSDEGCRARELEHGAPAVLAEDFRDRHAFRSGPAPRAIFHSSAASACGVFVARGDSWQRTGVSGGMRGRCRGDTQNSGHLDICPLPESS